MNMTSPLDDVCCARLPAAALAHLGALRVRTDVRVLARGDELWLRWPAGDEDVLHRVLSVRGAEVFAQRDGLWYRPGRSLPTFGVPDELPQTLLHLLAPEPVKPEGRIGNPSYSDPVRLCLARDDTARPASALCCALADLDRWAEAATARRLAVLEAAYCATAGGPRVLLLGERLPPLPAGERFWGRSVLAPLGWRPEPALGEAALRAALGVRPDEIALLRQEGVEVVPRSAFRPLTRAGIRLALREGR
jgi:hypothetical protein